MSELIFGERVIVPVTESIDCQFPSCCSYVDKIFLCIFVVSAVVLIEKGINAGRWKTPQIHNIKEKNSYSPKSTNREEVKEEQVFFKAQTGVPTFDPTTPRNITALKDSNAYLYCNIHNVGNKTVVWIREHDLHILTVGQFTYTADDRFEVIHKPNSTSWILKIHSVQPRDGGRYDCQVTTQPGGPITYPVWLNIYVPTARIAGSSERFVNKGSTINLTCIIEHHHADGTEASAFWFHNNKKINYENRENLVSVITDRGPITKTTLLIHDASDAASGVYSCTPSPSVSVTVKIHILNGQPPAAMQHNTTPSINTDIFITLINVFILVLLCR